MDYLIFSGHSIFLEQSYSYTIILNDNKIIFQLNIFKFLQLFVIRSWCLLIISDLKRKLKTDAWIKIEIV